MSANVVMRQVNKKFGDRTALSIDHLDLYEGQVVALIGPNGAGKSTLLRLISGLWIPTHATTLTVLGEDLRSGKTPSPAFRASLGFASDSSQLFGMLTVRENLEYVARLYRLPKKLRVERVLEAMELCNVTDRADDQVWTLSTGLKQRVNIARALITKPRLLYLDEPTSGLDPVAAQDVYTAIQRLKHEGVTILLATHLLGEVDELCDRALFISHGSIVADGAPEELQLMSGEVVHHLDIPSERLDAVREHLAAHSPQTTAPTLIIRSDNGASAQATLYGKVPHEELDRLGLTYTRRRSQLADTFWLLGGQE